MANFNCKFSNAVKQLYKGNFYHSKAEAKYAMYLDKLLVDKKIKSWQYEKNIELKGENKNKICSYKIDFTVYHNNKIVEFVEIKGFKTAVWKIKWKLFNDKYKKNNKYKITLLEV